MFQNLLVSKINKLEKEIKSLNTSQTIAYDCSRVYNMDISHIKYDVTIGQNITTGRTLVFYQEQTFYPIINFKIDLVTSRGRFQTFLTYFVENTTRGTFNPHLVKYQINIPSASQLGVPIGTPAQVVGVWARANCQGKIGIE